MDAARVRPPALDRHLQRSCRQQGVYPSLWIHEHAGAKLSVHIAFTAADRMKVDAFHEAAFTGGGTDDGGPGVRERYHPTYYAAYVLDPDGNNVEDVCQTE